MSPVLLGLSYLDAFEYVRPHKKLLFMNLILISIIVFIINIPFGYWRANVKRFSLQWVLAVHLPVPVIILIRMVSEIGFEITSYIFIVFAYFLGQAAGIKIFEKKRINNTLPLTSCLVMDIFRTRKSSQ